MVSRKSDRTFFIIFSLCRSGSTTLHRALNLHPNINIKYEPNLGKIDQSPSELKAILHNLKSDFMGIKHVWDPNGFPFIKKHISKVSEMEPIRNKVLKMNKLVLGSPVEKVIFIRRRNILARVVSDQIGQQSNTWGPRHNAMPSKSDAKEFETRISQTQLTAIDCMVIEWYLKNEQEMTDELYDWITETKIPCFDLTFEDLFDNPSRTGRRNIFNEILEFLEQTPFPETSIETLDTLLDPGNGKLNSKATYAMIPNIEEIISRYTDIEKGWFLE